MKLGEFFIDLVVNAGSGELTVKNLVSQMGELEAATVGEIGALFELGVRLAAVADHSIKSALGLEEYASRTGESTVKLQEWQAAAEMAHVSAETVHKTFDNLSQGLESMKWGEPTGVLKGAVQILGIDPTGKDVYQVMDAISAELTRRYGKNQASKLHVLSMMGMGDMMRVLDMSKTERTRAVDDAYIMSQKQQRTYIEIDNKLIHIQRAAKNLAQTMVDWSAPTLLRTLTEALRLIKEIQSELHTGKGPIGKAAKAVSTSASGWGMLLELTGNKSVSELLGKGIKGLEELHKESQGPLSPQSAAAFLGARAVDPFQIFAPEPAAAAAGAGGQKVFHNSFTFPGITDAAEAKRAAHAIIQDQSDDTEWQLNRGATK